MLKSKKERNDSRGKFSGRWLSAVLVPLWLLTGLVFSAPAIAQTDEEIRKAYEDAQELYHLSEQERTEDIFKDISDRLCGSEKFLEECVESKILRAVIRRSRREFEAAENFLTGAKAILDENFEREHYLNIRLLTEFSYLMVDSTELALAENWSREAVAIVKESNLSGERKALAHLSMGMIKDEQGDYALAVREYQAALDAVEGAEVSMTVSRILMQGHNNIGVAYRRLGRVEDAMQHYQTNLKIVKEVYENDHPQLGFAYNSLGSAYYSKGDYGTAAEYFLQSAAVFQAAYGENYSRVAAALNNAGISYFYLDDLESATHYLERAQRIKENILGADHPDTAVGYSNLAAIHQENKNYSAAQNNFERSIAVRKKAYGPDHPNLVLPYLKFGEFYLETEDHPAARQQLTEALRIALGRLGANHPDVSEIHYLLGNSFLNEENFKEAFSHYEKAFQQLTDRGFEDRGMNFDPGTLSYPIQFINVARAIAGLKQEQYRQSGSVADLYDAVAFYDVVSETIDLLQTQYQSEASKLNLIGQNYSIYTGAIEAMYLLYEKTASPLWLDKMLLYTERSRSRIALELLQRAEAKQFGGVPEDILEEENALNARVTHYYQQLHLEQEKGLDADETRIGSYRDSLFHARRDVVRFTENLEKNHPAYYALKYEQHFVDRAQLPDLLDEDETLVTYIAGETDLFVLILNREKITARRLGPAEGLAEQISGFKSSVVNRQAGAYRKEAYALYQQLVEPIESLLETPKLIIVPDQMLHYLPFELLLSAPPGSVPDHQLPYWIREKEISYAPSATVLRFMSGQMPQQPRHFLALAPFGNHAPSVPGDSASNRHIGGLSSLPFTRYETREIANLFQTRNSFRDYFSPEKTVLMTDEEASETRLTSELLNPFSYLHFATHAFVHENDPALSGIALQHDDLNDGIVYVNDIYNLELNAALVVLGACETGLGSIQKGEGLIGFTRAFIYAGASNLLVSMWKVSDQPTADLMVRFYQYIREGQSYGRALRQAKLDLINRPETAAPYNWAAFVLNGR